MSTTPGLKTALKRGALIAAANWPLALIQFIADSALKLMLAVPVLGGALLVNLLLDRSLSDLLSSGSYREIVPAILASLTQNWVALTAFAIACLVVFVGGSIGTFVVKAGVVALMADAERTAGPIERSPLTLDALRRVWVVAIDPFLSGSLRLWRRYIRIGLGLLIVYAGTAALYLGFVLSGYALAGNSVVMFWWTIASALALSAIIVWVTIVNFFYLITQMVVAIEDVSVRAGVRLATQFIVGHFREVAAVFGVVLIVVLLAVGVDIVATAGLGLIAFVPLIGLIVLPLQLAAWLLRGIIFEYLALAALGAYLSHYRWYHRGADAQPPLREVPGVRLA